MALLTDVIDPATLTGYIRAAISDTLTQKKTLAVFLPLVNVDDVVVEFMTGQAGLVPAANFRAYDAAPDSLDGEQGEEVLLKLPAIGTWEPVSEYNLLRARNANISDERFRDLIKAAAKRAVTSVLERLEATMGAEIATGKIVAKTGKFSLSEDFGRDASLTVTAGTKWSAAAADVLGDLSGYAQVYADLNGGERPGVMAVSSQVALAMAKTPAFATALAGGKTRPATQQDVNDLLVGSDLPQLFVYDRKVRVGVVNQPVLPADSAFLLPAPVAPEGQTGSALGATYVGVPLSATQDSWRIQEEDRSGIVAGAHQADVPPHIMQVFADAVALPVLANANASMAIKVL